MCDRVLGKDKDLWEKEVFRFKKDMKLKVISLSISLLALRMDVYNRRTPIIKSSFTQCVVQTLILFCRTFKNW